MLWSVGSLGSSEVRCAARGPISTWPVRRRDPTDVDRAHPEITVDGGSAEALGLRPDAARQEGEQVCCSRESRILSAMDGMRYM